MPSFGLNGATTGEEATLEIDIRAAAQAGYEYVELRDTKIERYLTGGGGTLPSLRARLREARVDALSINALEDATLPMGQNLQARLARMRVLCEWAAALGAPYVVAVPNFLPPAGLPESQVRVRTAAALRALAGVAAPLGVQVGFEFLGFPTCSVSTLRAARGIIEDTADPRIGLVIDAFHFYAGGSRLEDLDGLDASRLFIVHLDDAEPGEPARLTDAQRLLPGDGVIHLRALVARLQMTGFKGAYSLELFRPEYWAWDPVELARRGLDSMHRLFT
jgi:2-keto-myo-inositol isomerase